jgi:hypothetical protein
MHCIGRERHGMRWQRAPTPTVTPPEELQLLQLHHETTTLQLQRLRLLQLYRLWFLQLLDIVVAQLWRLKKMQLPELQPLKKKPLRVLARNPQQDEGNHDNDIEVIGKNP